MAIISDETFKAIKADLSRVEDITQAVRDAKGIDPYDLDGRIEALAVSIQLLSSCLELLAMKARK